jgi:glycerophosphoryl diester phosphodiesterase
MAANSCAVIAHRGFSAVAPENTLAAMMRASELGVDACEMDVYRCKSGEIVVIHDGDVKRTTDGEGKITEMTLDEIQKLDAGSWKGQQYAGEGVPTLRAVLKHLKAANCRAVVEIKMEGISQDVLDVVKAEGMWDMTAIIAFSSNVVKDVRSLASEMQCAWLYGEEQDCTPAEMARWIADQARACDTDIVDLAYTILSEEVIAELHKRGLTVWTWTVNDPERMADLIRWGVDGITTNCPDELLCVRKNYTEK